jgi:hypothetical protein
MIGSDEHNLISYCGICCSLCPAFRGGDCPGCYELKGCKIHQCAKSKDINFCFLCYHFPCDLFEKGFDWNLNDFSTLEEYKPGIVKWKPFSDVYIHLFKMVKKNRKK